MISAHGCIINLCIVADLKDALTDIFHILFSPYPAPLLEIQRSSYGYTPHPFWSLWVACPPRQLLGQKKALSPATMTLHTHSRPTLGILLEQLRKLGSHTGAVDIDLVSLPP